MNGISDQALRETLRTMYQLRTTTRANIIEVTRLSAGIVSQALQLLLRRGMILKVGELESDGGRRKEVLTLNQEAIYFIGVDLESHRIRFGLTNLGGDIRYRWEEEVETTGSMDVRRLFDGIEKVAGTLNSGQRSRLQAVGISYPGVMDPQGRLTAVNLGWRKFPFMSELEKVRKAGRLDELPIFLEPDAQGNMRAELLLGRAQHHRNGIYVSCDRGIGLGILLDGKVVEGSRNMAGELGHVTVDPDAQDRCNCGKRGCLEAIATRDNIVRQYLEKVGKGSGVPSTIRFPEILKRARNGEPSAVAVVRRACGAWGLALSHVVNLLNPEIIVLGGDLVAAEDIFVPLIREELLRHTLPELADGLQIAVSSLGLDIRLKGAASLAFRKCLADPVWLKKMCRPVLVSEKRTAQDEDSEKARK